MSATMYQKLLHQNGMGIECANCSLTIDNHDDRESTAYCTDEGERLASRTFTLPKGSHTLMEYGPDEMPRPVTASDDLVMLIHRTEDTSKTRRWVSGPYKPFRA